MLLTVDKKAATEAEARVLLEQSFNLTDPFNIPTISFHPEEFQLNPFPVQARLDTIWLPLTTANVAKRKLFQWEEENLDSFPKSCVLGGSDGYADGYGCNEFKSPRANLVAAPSRNWSVHSYAEKCLDQIVSLPGPDAAWKFLFLWHEIGHGTGAGEPQTEKMAAIILRKAFAPTVALPVLNACADVRAVDIILGATGAALEIYPWSMVEALDDIAGFDQEQIDNMKEYSIKDLRFERMEEKLSATCHFRDIIRKCNSRAHDEKNLQAMANSAGFCHSNIFNADTAEHKIAHRFALACRRLSVGTSAYMDAPVMEHPALTAA